MSFSKSIHQTLASKETYAALFKAFIAISTLWLISAYQVSSLMLPLDVDAHKHKFVVEYELKRDIDFNELNCTNEMVSFQDCKMAVHKFNLVEASFSFFDIFQIFLVSIAILLIALCGYGFFVSLIRRKKY